MTESTVGPGRPTLDKMMAVRDKSQAIGEFMEWLQDKGYQPMRWVEQDEEVDCNGGLLNECLKDHPRRTCSRCKDTGKMNQHWEGYVADLGSIETALAEFFEIDLEAAEREKRALLEDLRNAQP